MLIMTKNKKMSSVLPPFCVVIWLRKRMRRVSSEKRAKKMQIVVVETELVGL
jgi:hypothetical protein